MDFSITKAAPDLGREYGKHRMEFFRLPLLASLGLLLIVALVFSEASENFSVLWALAIFGLLWAVYCLASWHTNRMILHHNGIVYRRLLLPDKTFYFQPNMRVFVRKWQYSWIFSAWKTAPRIQIILQQRSGAKLKLSPYWKHQERVLSVLRQYQLIHTLPRLHEAYANGETLDFGGVQLDGSGIWINQKHYGWQQYKPRIGDGWLYVYKTKANGKTQWRASARIPLAKISEAKILLDFIGFDGAAFNDYLTEHYKLNPFF